MQFKFDRAYWNRTNMRVFINTAYFLLFMIVGYSGNVFGAATPEDWPTGLENVLKKADHCDLHSFGMTDSQLSTLQSAPGPIVNWATANTCRMDAVIKALSKAPSDFCPGVNALTFRQCNRSLFEALAQRSGLTAGDLAMGMSGILGGAQSLLKHESSVKEEIAAAIAGSKLDLLQIASRYLSAPPVIQGLSNNDQKWFSFVRRGNALGMRASARQILRSSIPTLLSKLKPSNDTDQTVMAFDYPKRFDELESLYEATKKLWNYPDAPLSADEDTFKKDSMGGVSCT